MKCFPNLNRRWKNPRVFIIILVLELFGTVAVLAMFGIAEPNLYRTKMWQIGYDNQFNSSPKQILYAYANHRPIPPTPFVWSGALTQFNVAISVLSTFVMIVKAVLFTLHVWYPLIGVVANAILSGLYLASIYGQAGPDKSDARYPSSTAWYITKSCDYAKASGNVKYCQMAKGTFAVTVFMAALFLTSLVLAIWSLIPSAAQRAASKVEYDEDQVSKDSPTSDHSDRNRTWEMKSVPSARATPVVPYTPRTLAFNTLDRQLPLRAQQQQTRWQ